MSWDIRYLIYHIHHVPDLLSNYTQSDILLWPQSTSEVNTRRLKRTDISRSFIGHLALTEKKRFFLHPTTQWARANHRIVISKWRMSLSTYLIALLNLSVLGFSLDKTKRTQQGNLSTNLAVILNIFQNAFDPSPLPFEHFEDLFLTDWGG